MSASGRRLVRDAAALFLGEVLGKIAGFVAFAYLARTLTPPVYGGVELAVALSLLFSLLVDFGFAPIGAREIARDPGQAAALAARIPAARLLLAVFAFAGMVGVAALLDQPAETTRLVTLFAFAIFGTAWAARWLFQGLDMMLWASLPQALRMIVFAAAVVWLVAGDADLWLVGVAEIAASVFLALYFVGVQWALVAPVRLDFDRTALRRLFAEAAPVGASQLVWAGNQYLPTVLIAVIVGGAEVAWYGSAHRVVTALGTFVWIYHFNLFPSLVRAREAGGGALGGILERSFRIASWSGIACGLAATLYADEICRLAFGADFGLAALPFAVIAWVIPVTLISGHARFSLLASGLQRYELGAQLGGALVTLSLGLALVPLYGARGAACGALAGSVVAWLVAHRFASRLVGPVPFVGALLRPVGTAAGALFLGWILAPASPWGAGALALVVYTGGALLLEPALLRDLRALRAEAASRVGAGASRSVAP